MHFGSFHNIQIATDGSQERGKKNQVGETSWRKNHNDRKSFYFLTFLGSVQRNTIDWKSVENWQLLLTTVGMLNYLLNCLTGLKHWHALIFNLNTTIPMHWNFKLGNEALILIVRHSLVDIFKNLSVRRSIKKFCWF